MAPNASEDVYATLLTNDAYLPGALVLAHSLRDAGTTKKLAVLVTLDTVSAEAVTELKTVYDYILSVPRIQNEAAPANLHLMNRPDLHSAFTKINLWKQMQFRKIVYIDADVVAYRAPDELFDVPHIFAAAPDIGWPDLFNTGVMVLTPDIHEYYALAALAQRGVSFDGADQGLLNMHFRNAYHRLSFTYNVTPSAHYQYLPAYRHFQSAINMVHFIGADKPWFQGRSASTGGGPYDEMVARWWSVYDRHYRPNTSPSADSQEVPKIVQYFVKGEFQPTITYTLTSTEPSLDLGSSSTYGQQFETLPPSPPPESFFVYQQHPAPPPPPPASGFPHDVQHHGPHEHDGHGEAQAQSYPHHERSQHHQHQEHDLSEHAPQSYPPSPSQQATSRPPFSAFTSASTSASFFVSDASTNTETRADQVYGPRPGTSQPPAPEQEQKPYQTPTEPSWDAQWQPPPANAKPEALNFPQTHYEMSHDITPFVPPERYPSPPRDMWYSVPSTPATQKAPPIFPWEAHQPAPTRVFAESPSGQSGSNPRRAEFSTIPDPRFADLKTEPSTPTMPSAIHALPASSDPWASFTHTNAWDDMPQIERYVNAFQKQHRRVRSRGQAPGQLHLGDLGSGSAFGGGDGTDDDGTAHFRHGSKVTDFPSEVERPSLPVTPAPIRRANFWGGGGSSFGNDEDGAGSGGHLLPAAQGVPQQVDWDPLRQLQKLAEKQPKLLLQKFGLAGDERQGAGENGSSGGGKSTTPSSRSLSYESGADQSPTYVAEAPVISPKPVKPGGQETSSVRDIHSILGGSGSEMMTSSFLGTTMEQPSYLGPGIEFEKDEGIPEHEQTAALPSEEELDVLDT